MKLEQCSPALRRRIEEQILDEDNRLSQGSIAQRPVLHESLDAPPGEKGNSGRVSVRITSVRKRLADPDNLVGKYFLDCCRYCGFLKDDTATDIEYTIAQSKVEKDEDERTEILISPA